MLHYLFSTTPDFENLEESVNAIIIAISMVGDAAIIFIISTPNGRSGYYAERSIINRSAIL